MDTSTSVEVSILFALTTSETTSVVETPSPTLFSRKDLVTEKSL